MTGIRPFLFLSLALAGCAAVESNGDSSPEIPADVESSPVQETLPAAELTPELLYDLLAGEMALQRGELAFAAKKYIKAARETSDPRLAQRATRVAVYQRDFGTALQAAELWSASAPDDNEARQSLVALLLEAGRYDEALTHLEALLDASGKDTEQGFGQVTALLGRIKDKQQALGMMNRLVEPRKTDPNAPYSYAHLAFLLDEHQRSLQTLDELLKQHRGLPQAVVLKATVLSRMGRREEAIAYFGNEVDAAPKNSELRLSFARMLLEEKRLPEARKQFDILAKQLPDNPDIMFAVALLAFESGDLDTAEKRFKGLVDSGERADEAAYSLGRIAEVRKEPERAVEWYTTVGRGSENYLDSRLRVAVLVASKDGIEPALKYLDSVQPESDDQQVRVYLAKGEILGDAKRYADAKLVFDRALVEYPGHSDLLYARAMVAERLGRIDLLEADLNSILADDPENGQVLNALGYTLADRTERYDEAYRYIERALKQQPDDPATLDSMGWVLYRLGRHDEALEYLRRAASLFQDSEVHAHLGEVLWVKGKRDEALRLWKEALERDPDNQQLRDVMQKFGK